MAAVKDYPVKYRDMARRGFRFLTVSEKKCVQTILWQNPQTQEHRITLRFKNGQVHEYERTSDGTLTLVKPRMFDVNAKHRFEEIDVEVGCDHGLVAMGTVVNGISIGVYEQAAHGKSARMNREQAILVRDGLTKCIEARDKDGWR